MRWTNEFVFAETKVALERQDLERCLRSLAERLELADAPPTTLFVCGGSALLAMGLITRATKDVDVMALVRRRNGGQTVLEKAAPLPAYLVEAIEGVAKDLGLPMNWLNAGPAGMLDIMPVGCFERAEQRDFGPRLQVWLMSRYDHIHLKLKAAIGDAGGIHIEDLKALTPTHAEILDAARWARVHLSSRIGFWYWVNMLFWIVSRANILFRALSSFRVRDRTGFRIGGGLRLVIFFANVRRSLYGAGIWLVFEVNSIRESIGRIYFR